MLDPVNAFRGLDLSKLLAPDEAAFIPPKQAAEVSVDGSDQEAGEVVVCLLLTSRERVLLVLTCQRLTLTDHLIDEWFSRCVWVFGRLARGRLVLVF